MLDRVLNDRNRCWFVENARKTTNQIKFTLISCIERHQLTSRTRFFFFVSISLFKAYLCLVCTIFVLVSTGICQSYSLVEKMWRYSSFEFWAQRQMAWKLLKKKKKNRHCKMSRVDWSVFACVRCVCCVRNFVWEHLYGTSTLYHYTNGEHFARCCSVCPINELVRIFK